MLTGYLSTLPSDCLLSAGVLFCIRSGALTRVGVTEGPPDFDDQSELGEIMFDNRAPSRLKGLSRTVGFAPLIKGTLKEFGSSATGNQILVIEPGETEATAAGVTTVTPKPTGVFYAVGDYITDFRWVFERASGGYACIYAPLAIVRKWSAKGVDKKEAQISFEIEAAGDPTNDLGTAPYVIELRTSLPSLDEVSFLRAGISGGDSAILGIYSARTSVMATDGSGNITSMQDARGAGFLGNLTPQSANGPHLTGTDPATRTIDLSNGHTLMSALLAQLALTGDFTIAIVSTQNGASQGSTAAIGQADFTIWFGDAYYDLLGWTHGAAKDGTGFQNVGGTNSSNSRNYSGKIRLHVYDKSGTSMRQTAFEYDEESVTIRAFAGGSQRLLFGFDSSIPTTQSARAVLLLNRSRTTADLAVLHSWAQAYHASGVTGSPKFMAFEGDSLTSGLIVGPNNRWPAQMLAMTGFETVDEVIRAVSQSLINSTFFGSALNISSAARVAAIDGKYDPTRSRNVLVVLAGRNNLAVIPETGATVAASLFGYCDARRAVGWKVILCTVFDTVKQGGEAVASQAVLDTERANLNAALVAGFATHADALVQLHTTTGLTDRTNATNFNADQVHLTTAGQTIVANAVKTAALALLA